MDDRKWVELTDAGKAAKADAVLRVKLVSAEGANKYGWDKVDVIHVIKAGAGVKFPKQIEIAHYSWEPGIPPGESTVYLEPYAEEGGKGLWKLLTGSASGGVSHSQ